jgi:hypothetical protein
MKLKLLKCGFEKMKIKYYFADLLFLIGHKFIITSARLMGYEDTVKELKESQAHWLKTDAFKKYD